MLRDDGPYKSLDLSKKFQRLFSWDAKVTTPSLSNSESHNQRRLKKEEDTLSNSNENVSCTPMLQPTPSRCKNVFAGLEGNSQTSRSAMLVDLADTAFPLPEIAARFDESPWIWGKVDTSPLKLSDMQLPITTPESIKRQRNSYARSSDHSRTQSISNSSHKVSSSNSQVNEFSTVTDPSHAEENHSLLNTQCFSQNSLNDDGDSQSRMGLYSSDSKSINLSHGNEEHSSETCSEDHSRMGKCIDMVNSSSFNYLHYPRGLFDIGMSDSVTLTYTHTERMSMASMNSCREELIDSWSPHESFLRSNKNHVVSSGVCTNFARSNHNDSNTQRQQLRTVKEEQQKKKLSNHEGGNSTYELYGLSNQKDIPLGTEKEHKHSLSRPKRSSFHRSSGGSKKIDPHELSDVSSLPRGRSRSYDPSESENFSICGSLHDPDETKRSLSLAAENAKRSRGSLTSNHTSRVSLEIPLHRSDLSNSARSTSSRLASEVARWRRLCQETVIRAQRMKPHSFSSTRDKISTTHVSPVSCYGSERANPPHSCDEKTLQETPTSLIETKLSTSGGESRSLSALTIPHPTTGVSDNSSLVPSTVYNRLMNKTYYLATDLTDSSLRNNFYHVKNALVEQPVWHSSEDLLANYNTNHAVKSIPVVSTSMPALKSVSQKNSPHNLDWKISSAVQRPSIFFNQAYTSKAYITPQLFSGRVSHVSSSRSTDGSHSTNATGKVDSAPYSTTFSHDISDSTLGKTSTIDMSDVSFRPISASSDTNIPSFTLSSTPISDTVQFDVKSRFFYTNTSSCSSLIEETGPSTYFGTFHLRDYKFNTSPKRRAHYGSCLFVQGPTPGSHNKEKPSLDLVRYTPLEKRQTNCLTMSPSARATKEVPIGGLTAKEEDMDYTSFVTPYPIREALPNVVEKRPTYETKELVALSINDKTCPEALLNQCSSLHAERKEEPGKTQRILFFQSRNATYRVATKRFRVHTQNILSTKKIRFHGRKNQKTFLLKHRNRRSDVYSTVHQRKVALPDKKDEVKLKGEPFFTSRFPLKVKVSKTLNLLKRPSSCSDIIYRNKVAEGQQIGKNPPSKKAFYERKNSTVSDLSALWLELDRQLRESGFCKEGIPVLDPNVSKVYTGFLSVPQSKVQRKASQYSALRSLRAERESWRLNSSGVSNTSDFHLSRRKMLKDSYLLVSPNLKGLNRSKKKHVVYSKDRFSSDALAVLFSNVDIVKVIKLWNHTLYELQKYQRYCSELYQFEDSHLRVFQMNDTLQKENNELKEKVETLERLLQHGSTSEWASWEAELTHYQLKMKNAHLTKLLKEESQRLNIVAMQKRQSDKALYTIKEKVKALLEKEEAMRVKAKKTLEKLKKTTAETSAPLTKAVSQETLRDFKAEFGLQRRLHSLSAKRNPLGSHIAKKSDRFSRERSDLSTNQTVMELVWYYEEQLKQLRHSKKSSIQPVLPVQHSQQIVLKGVKSLEDAGTHYGEFQDSHGEKGMGTGELRSIYQGGFLETLATTAATHLSHDAPNKDVDITTGQAREVQVEALQNAPDTLEKKTVPPSPRWLMTELHTQLKNTIEEKAKNEIQYQYQIEQLKTALEDAKRESKNNFSREESEETSLQKTNFESDCDLVRGTRVIEIDTRQMIQRDKKLFKCGLVEKLDALQRTGSLLPLVSQVCRVLEVQDPRRLLDIVSNLSAAINEAVLQQQFLKSAARILGNETLYTQHQYTEMEHILLKWRHTFCSVETILLIKQHFLTLLDYVKENRITGDVMLKSLQSALRETSMELCRTEPKVMVKLLSLALDKIQTLEEHSEHIHLSVTQPSCVLPNTTKQLNASHSSEEEKSQTANPLLESIVNHLMKQFQIPSLRLCQAAIDRLHLKLGEHIRFYRGVLTVLNASSHSTPAQILQQIAQLNNRVGLSDEHIKQEIFQDFIKQATVTVPAEQLKDMFKVFRAMQIRLNLPDPPCCSLSNLFVLYGDQGIVEPTAVSMKGPDSRSPTYEIDHEKEGCSLLSCSSSLLSSSSQNPQEKEQWKNWAKICLFTVDLLARVVECSSLTTLLKKKKKSDESSDFSVTLNNHVCSH